MTAQVDVLVIGAGQAGLAASYELTQRGREHLLVDGGSVGEAWRSRRWDSFRLVTPSWCMRLPGLADVRVDPDGFMSAEALATLLDRYAESFRAPTRVGVRVSSLRPTDTGFVAESSQGPIQATSVVVATGPYQRASIPLVGNRLGPSIVQLSSDRYRSPDQLPPGGVLVVGSGQSGVQIADELLAHERRVYLSVGSCGWVPRRYRGRDITRWLVEMRLLEKTVDSLLAPEARLACFPQLSGVKGGRDCNIHTLANAGTVLIGRVHGASATSVFAADDVDLSVDAANAFAARIKDAVDTYASALGIDEADDWPRPARLTAPPTSRLDLSAAKIGTVIWACGYRLDFSWIKLPIFDRFGFPLHERGVSRAPGLYFLGLPWLHKWKSATLLGVGEDAAFIADSILAANQAARKRTKLSRRRTTMATQQQQTTSPLPLMQLATGFWASKTLFAAHDLDVFSFLAREGGATPVELADSLGIAERPAEMMLTACASLGLLEKRDGRYRNSPLADEYLVRGRPSHFGGFLDLNDKRLYRSWGQLVEAIRTNRPVGWSADTQRSFFDSDDPEITIGFYEAMHSLSTPTGRALTQSIDFSRYSRLLDLGGGSAAIDIEVCRAFPRLRATVFDLATVVPFADAKIADANLEDRIETVAGDFFTDDAYPEGHDLAILSLILHAFTETQNREILRKCHDCLPTGGQLLISELLVNDDKTGPPPAALMSLTMLVEDEGRNYTAAEYSYWLTEIGFRDIRLLPIDVPAANGIVIATK